ncbi:beta-ketoadipyl CoA thiolase [Halobacteriovorax marinus]|uniref:acetyl-CoA C-acyltransferase n=1 Tax=Halobacteriovorax marinus TaxID=97084 RepID=A0A1Y5FDR3_9BACT|nr:beta-ketoadipyl CoA thiolase [Halobacteriovorax marinus]
MTKSYIIYAKRTPIGKLGGGLSNVRVDDMLALLFKDFKDQATFDLTEIDDVIVGCANQAGEDNRNLARMSSVLAGFPYEVPGTTINRLCGSSLDAVMDAVGRINAGFGDCFVVGGAESMTRAPFVVSKASSAFGRDSKMYDTTFGWRFPNPKMKELFPLFGMGETAEEVAEQYKITREDQDQFALNSHKKAHAAWENGSFDEEVLPVEVKLRKSSFTVARDEGPRADTSLEKLGKLRAVFREGGTVTAGNASMMNDGASAVVVVSEEFLKKHKLTALVEVTGAAVRGVHPNVMGLGPIEATKTLCKRFNKKVSDFDVVELNEAFAAQALACIRELGLDESKVNLNGGAISLGHPLGCSGARILTTLIHIMKKNPELKEGLASMCIGVGQGIALSVKQV